MPYALGIDTGGTYTDAVVINIESKEIVIHYSVLTTYPNLDICIKKICEHFKYYLNIIEYVVLSTTLATNSILENKLNDSALILIGPKDKINDSFLSSIKYFQIIKGGHDSNGNEEEKLDLDALTKYILSIKNKVSSFAISSYFSVRNQEHEYLARSIILKLTGYPCVCGHELDQTLGIYERGITAYLNASLLYIIQKFINSVKTIIYNYNNKITIHILNCNGSISTLNEATEKPIKTILSGPAASLLGASFITKLSTYVVIDVGGTSTDIAMMNNGFPEINSEGAKINEWKTKVESLNIETIPFGGDSHIWIQLKNNLNFSKDVSILCNKINIGPIKVIPLCRAATKFPKLLFKLKERWFSESLKFGQYIQPTTYYIRSNLILDNRYNKITQEEIEIYSRIEYEPKSLIEITWDMKYIPIKAIEKLVTKNLIQIIGLTPTDIFHVIGTYKEWNVEASKIGIKIITKYLQINENIFLN